MTLHGSENPPAFFPEALFAQPAVLPADRGWKVVRTRSRQEKALAWELNAREIPYYLPMQTRPQKNKNRIRASIVPLFSGYLFFRGDAAARSEVMKTGRAAQVIEVVDQEQIAAELAALALVTTAQAELELCDFVTTGRKVRIIGGPFMGLTGTVRKLKNKTRLILTVEAIRQAAAVEIALDQALPI